MSHSTPNRKDPDWPDFREESCALYLIDEHSITCRLCGHRSFDPGHVHNRFCPNCLTFFEDRSYMQRLDEGLRIRFEPRDDGWQHLKAA